MENEVELIISNGKTIPQKVMKCNKCGKFIVSSDGDNSEWEDTRKICQEVLGYGKDFKLKEN